MLIVLMIVIFGIVCGVMLMGRRIGELTADKEELNQYR